MFRVGMFGRSTVVFFKGCFTRPSRWQAYEVTLQLLRDPLMTGSESYSVFSCFYLFIWHNRATVWIFDWYNPWIGVSLHICASFHSDDERFECVCKLQNHLQQRQRQESRRGPKTCWDLWRGCRLLSRINGAVSSYLLMHYGWFRSCLLGPCWRCALICFLYFIYLFIFAWPKARRYIRAQK